jgi:hypothetical protein
MLSHAMEVLGWHFAFSPTPPLVAMLSSEPALGAAPGLPFACEQPARAMGWQDFLPRR